MDLYHQLPSDLQRYVRLHRHAMDTRAACVIQRHFRKRIYFDMVHKWPDKCYSQIHQSVSSVMQYVCAATDGTCLLRTTLVCALRNLHRDYGYLSISLQDGSQIFVICEGLLSEDVVPGWHYATA